MSQVKDKTKEKKKQSRKKPDYKRHVVRGRLMFVVSYHENGKRKRKHLHTASEAETFAEQVKTLKANQGAAAFSLPDKLRVEAHECAKRLAAVGASISMATDFYLQYAVPAGGKRTVQEAMNAYLDEKLNNGADADYIKNQRTALRVFWRDFPDRTVNSIFRQDIETWLASKNWKPLNRRNYIRDVSMFFEYAVAKELCPSNPLAKIQRPTVRQETPEIFSVEQAEKLLKTADAHPELGMLPTVALGLFAGLRICELKRLDWSAVKMDDEHIVLGPEVVKRITMPRNVDILPNLAAWLRTYVKTSGPVIPTGFRRRRDELCKFMKLEDWPDNGLRHSFASYHLVKFDKAQLTQLQMGQQTASVLFKHYRQVVSRKDAERYWNLFRNAEERAAAEAAASKVLPIPTAA